MKCKVAFLIMSALILNMSYGMRRSVPVMHTRATCPRRSVSYKVDQEIVPLKVIPPRYLEPQITAALKSMTNEQKKHVKYLNEIIKTNAINGENERSDFLLRDMNDVERSLVLDQVNLIQERSLLIKAAQIGYLDFMNFLLDHGANAKIADKDGLTALNINPRRLNTLIVEKLLNNSADCMQSDIFKRNVLHYLARRHCNGYPWSKQEGEDYSVYEEMNGKVARRLIPEGANMYGLDIYELTPIDYALKTDHLEMLKVFIECGANAEIIRAQASPKILMDLEQHCAKY